MPIRRKRIRHHFTERAYSPYATAIGRVALSWNSLHEELGLLFCRVMSARAASRQEDVVMAVWHSSQTDRAKRKMLEAALKVTEAGHPTNMGEDIKWVLKRADELEEDRNNAIHAPLFHMGPNEGLASTLLFELPSGVFADVLSGNPRAEKLVAKNILAEFKRSHKATVVLRDFARRVHRAISHTSDQPWPQRPKLPPRPARK